MPSYADTMDDETTPPTTPTARVDDRLREEYERLTESLCKAVNDPKRLLILHLLGEEDHAVGELAEALDASQANVSQHLAVLREQGLVDTERDGTRVIYSLRHRRVLDAIAVMREVLVAETERRAALLG